MSQAISSETHKAPRKTHRLSTPIDSLIARIARRVGRGRAKEVERFIKFGFVGVLGFLIDAGTVLMLQNSLLPPVNALGEPQANHVILTQSIAFLLAVCSNFVWNRLWTYPDSRSRSATSQLTQFTLVSVAGWAIRTAWMSLSYEPLGQFSTAFIRQFNADYAPTLLDQHKLGTMVALIFGVVVVMLWNFLANRYWTYNDVD